MKLILHIGAPKTGSTAIQAALRLNKALIDSRSGYYFNADPRALTTLFVRPGAGFFLQERLRHGDPETAQAWSREQWRRFETEVDETRPDFAIVSSENFMTTRFLDRMLDRFRERFSEIVAIGYVRDPVDLYPSGIDQRIRGGDAFARLPAPEDFPYLVHKKLRRIRNLIGAGNLTVRNFARNNLHKGDIVSDFMRVLGEKAGVALDGAKAPPRQNDSLCAAATLWLLSVNEQLDYLDPDLDKRIAATRFETIKRLRDAEALQSFAKLRLDHPLLTDVLRRSTLDACRFINRQFLEGQEPLPLATGGGQMDLPAAGEQRAAMREWLMSHFDADAMRGVLEVAQGGGEARE